MAGYNASMSIAERMDLVQTAMDSIIEKAKSDDAMMVSLRDDIRSLCLENGLGFEGRFHCDSVVPHYKNRGGTVLETAEVPRKLSAFYSKGFSLLECKRAAGVERTPGVQGDIDEEKAIRVASMSNEQVAPIAKGSARVFSMTCSHTNQAIRLGFHGMPHADARFTMDGKISRATLAEKLPHLKTAMDSGIDWFVIRWEVAQRWFVFVG
jgi:hypothetical protein